MYDMREKDTGSHCRVGGSVEVGGEGKVQYKPDKVSDRPAWSLESGAKILLSFVKGLPVCPKPDWYRQQLTLLLMHIVCVCSVWTEWGRRLRMSHEGHGKVLSKEIMGTNLHSKIFSVALKWNLSAGPTESSCWRSPSGSMNRDARVGRGGTEEV